MSTLHEEPMEERRRYVEENKLRFSCLRTKCKVGRVNHSLLIQSVLLYGMVSMDLLGKNSVSSSVPKFYL